MQTVKRTNLISSSKWVLLVPVLLLAAWLGFRGLNLDNIGDDEVTTISHIGGMQASPRGPLEIANSLIEHSPQHTPAYFWLLNLWGRVAGWSPVPLRAFSVFFGLIALTLIYRLGRDTHSHFVGWCAVTLLATNAFFMYYIHEVRMYSMFIALSTLGFWFYYQALQTRHTLAPAFWVAYGLCTVILLYTHSFALLIVGSIGIYHLLFAPKHRRWWQISGVYVAAGVGYLPWVGVMVQGFLAASNKPTVQSVALSTENFLRVLAALFSNNSIGLIIPWILLGLYALYHQRSKSWVWLAALILLVLMVLLNELFRLVPQHRMRYTLGLWPLLAIMSGVGMAELQRLRWARWLLVPFFVIWPLAGLQLDGRLSEWSYAGTSNLIDRMLPFNELMPQLQKHVGPDDFIVVISASRLATRERDKHQQIVGDYYLSALDNDYALIYPPDAPADILDDTLNIIKNYPAVWLVYEPQPFRAPSAPLWPDFRQRLQAEYTLCQTLLDKPELHIDLYAHLTDGECPA